MSNLPGGRLYVQTESTLTRKPVGESLFQTMAAASNFLIDSSIFYHEWTINEGVNSFLGKSFVDGIKTMPLGPWQNWAIIGACIYGSTMGTTGNVTLDIQKAAFNTTGWTSIFSSQPSINWQAAAGVTVYNGDSVPNCVAPVLAANPVTAIAKDKLRMVVNAVQAGGAQNFGIRVFYRGA
jgi:hypothetical protein